ncbi:hypothetical protein KRP22_014317 [Phytophthora ramorum]|nr:hypothetical protein KRP22_9082 [Phytophthora ramorum]
MVTESAALPSFQDTTSLQRTTMQTNLAQGEKETDDVVPDASGATMTCACFSESTSFDDTDKVNPNLPRFDPLAVQHKSRREKEAIRKRIYHHRLKNERNTLRQTADELTQQLHELTQAKQAESTRNLSRFDSVWRDFALHERDLRLNSELEQLQLLAVTEAKASYIEKLRKELPTSPTDVAVAATTELLKGGMAQAHGAPPFDYTMYRGHLRRVNESYTQVDEVFRGLSMLHDGVTSSVQRRDKNGEVEYFQHLNKLTEPFSYKHTCQKMWQLIAKCHHRQHDREEFGEVEDSEDIIIVRFRVARTLTTGSTVSVLQRYVICRFEESDRTVFVWKTHSQGEGIFRGMHSDETGWICVEPATFEDDTTEIRVCVRQVPMSFSISGPGDSIVGEFHQMLQSFVDEDAQELTTALGSLLLEDTLSGIEM